MEFIAQISDPFFSISSSKSWLRTKQTVIALIHLKAFDRFSEASIGIQRFIEARLKIASLLAGCQR